MRDKVLCRGWTAAKAVNDRETFSPREKGYFLVFRSFFTFLSDLVPVSVQGGVKMSINEILGIFDYNKARIDQKAQKKSIEIVSRQELDIIFVAESLFRGTVVDFGDFGSYSGGGNYAKHDFAVN